MGDFADFKSSAEDEGLDTSIIQHCTVNLFRNVPRTRTHGGNAGKFVFALFCVHTHSFYQQRFINVIVEDMEWNTVLEQLTHCLCGVRSMKFGTAGYVSKGGITFGIMFTEIKAILRS